jgi:SAM-dependent methyltransferase
MADAYLADAGQYDRVRPGYPGEIADWVTAGLRGTGARATDVGAGTGLFTTLLVERGLTVTAVDPSEDMLAVLATRLPEVRCLTTTAEHTGLPEGSMDLLTIAQAWHWCDHRVTLHEAARVLAPGGRLCLVWNQLDVSVPWVHRLSRIMHAGDVFAPSYRPSFGPGFEDAEEFLLPWTQELCVADVVDLARSRSYYRNAPAPLRERVEANLHWYLTEYLAFPPDATVRLPYYTHAWRAPARPTGFRYA